MTELNSFALAHYEDTIRIDDCGKTMSNNEHCTVTEQLSYLALNQVVCLQIHVCSRFIKNQNFGFANDSPS
jgi:hypothetical protein